MQVHLLPAFCQPSEVPCATRKQLLYFRSSLSREKQIRQLTFQRDQIVQEMKDLLDGSANGHREHLIREGRELLEAAQALANGMRSFLLFLPDSTSLSGRRPSSDCRTPRTSGTHWPRLSGSEIEGYGVVGRRQIRVDAL